MDAYILGIDVGGTNIRLGLVNHKMELFHFSLYSTQTITNTNESVQGLVNLISQYMKDHAGNKLISAISIGFPSTINKTRTKLLSTPNIKGFDNLDIVRLLNNIFRIPVFIEKDVNLLMLYDMYQHSLMNEEIVLGFYLGTGLGNAIYINGNLLLGKHGSAAELGHIPSRDVEGSCGCGNSKCVELFASGKHLKELVDRNFPGTSIENVFQIFGNTPIIENYIKNCAIPIATEINIFDPKYIILGGGVIQMDGFPKKMFEEAILAFARKPFPANDLTFIYANESQQNGILGAYLYTTKRMGESK